jgi:hypothetical protein
VGGLDESVRVSHRFGRTADHVHQMRSIEAQVNEPSIRWKQLLQEISLVPRSVLCKARVPTLDDILIPQGVMP